MPTSGLYTQFTGDFTIIDDDSSEPLPLPILYFSAAYEKILKAKSKIRMLGALAGGAASVAAKPTLKGDTLNAFADKTGPLFGFDHTQWVEVDTKTKNWVEELENGDKKHVTQTIGKYQTNKVYIWHYNDLYEPRLKQIKGRPDLDFSQQRRKLETDDMWLDTIRLYPMSPETLRAMHNKLLEAKLRQELPEDMKGAPFKRMMDLMYQGVHGTWEMAVNRDHHPEMLKSGNLIQSVADIVQRQTHPRLLIPGCACIWTLGVNRKARAVMRGELDLGNVEIVEEPEEEPEEEPPAAAAPGKPAAKPAPVAPAPAAEGGEFDDEEELPPKEVPNGLILAIWNAMRQGLKLQHEVGQIMGFVERPKTEKELEDDDPEEHPGTTTKRPLKLSKEELKDDKLEGVTVENAELLQWMSIGALSLMIVDKESRHAVFLIDEGLETLVEFTKKRPGDEMFSQEYVDKRRLYAMKVILMIMQRSKEIRCKFVHYGGMELCMSIMEDMSDLPRLRFVAACCLALFTGDEDALREMLKSGKAGDLLRSAINTVHQGLILMRRLSLDRQAFKEKHGAYPMRKEAELNEVVIIEAAAVSLWGAAYALTVIIDEDKDGDGELDHVTEDLKREIAKDYENVDFWKLTTTSALCSIKNFFGCTGVCVSGATALFCRRKETCQMLYSTVGVSKGAEAPWLDSEFGFRIGSFVGMCAVPPEIPDGPEADELYDPEWQRMNDLTRATIAAAVCWMVVHNRESIGNDSFYGPFRYGLRQPFFNLEHPWFVGYDEPEIPRNMVRSLYRCMAITSLDVQTHRGMMEACAGAIIFLSTEGEIGNSIRLWDDDDFDDHLHEMEVALEIDAPGASQNFVAGMWVGMREDENRRRFLRMTPGWDEYEDGIADPEPEPEPEPEPPKKAKKAKKDGEEGEEGDEGDEEGEEADAEEEGAEEKNEDEDAIDAVAEAAEGEAAEGEAAEGEAAEGEAAKADEPDSNELIDRSLTVGFVRRVPDLFASLVQTGKGWLKEYLVIPADVDDDCAFVGKEPEILRHMTYWCALVWLVIVPPDAIRFEKEEIYKRDRPQPPGAPNSWWTTLSPQVGHGNEWGPGTDEALEVLVTIIIAPWKECHRRTKMVALGCAWSFAAINPSGAMHMADLGILEGLMYLCHHEAACTAAREYAGNLLMMLVENRERQQMAGYKKLASAYVALIDTAKPGLQANGAKGLQMLVNRDADLDNVDNVTRTNADYRKIDAAKAGAVRSLVKLLQRLIRRQTAALVGTGMSFPEGVHFGYPPELEDEGEGGEDGVDERPGAPGAPSPEEADEATGRNYTEMVHLRHVDDIECALRCARALLNLSINEDNQVYICRRGLYTILRAQCLYRLVDYEIVEALSGVLNNLASNYRNRTALYKAELRGTKAMQERKIAAGDTASRPTPVSGTGPKLPPRVMDAEAVAAHRTADKRLTAPGTLPPIRQPKASFDPLEGPLPGTEKEGSPRGSFAKEDVSPKPPNPKNAAFEDWAKGIMSEASEKPVPRYMMDAARTKEEIETQLATQLASIETKEREGLPRLPPQMCRPLREMWEPSMEKLKRDGPMRWRPDVLEYRQDPPEPGKPIPFMPSVAQTLLSVPRPSDAKRILGTALKQLCATGHVETEIWEEPDVEWERPTREELWEQGRKSDMHESLPVTVLMPAKSDPSVNAGSGGDADGSLATVPEAEAMVDGAPAKVGTAKAKMPPLLTLGDSRALTPQEGATREAGEQSMVAFASGTDGKGDAESSHGQGLKVVLAPKKGRSCISFKASVKDSEGGPRAASLALFEHVPGSRYWQDSGLDAHYLLPNGKETHYYYFSGDLVDEMGDTLESFPPRPTDLDQLMQIALAPPDAILEMSKPLSGMAPTKYRPQPELAPKPREHTLPVKDKDNLVDGFADMDTDVSPKFSVEPYLVFDERTVEQFRLEKKIIPKNRPPWRIEASVFWPRRKECDARTLWNTTRTQQKAAECDIFRLQSKEKFHNMLEKECAAHSKLGEKGVKKVYDMMAEIHHLVMNVMVYYNSEDPTGSAWHMGLNVWTRFMEDCKVPDPDSEFCKRSDLDTVHIISNFTADKKSDLYKVNSENGFLRFELLEALLRTALQKFCKGDEPRTQDPVEAFRFLIDEHIMPALPSQVQEPSNKFRSERLYCEDMDLLYIKHLDIIRALYSCYRLAPKSGGLRLKKWDVRSWDQFIADCGLIDQYFTIANSRMCYMYSRMLTIDEVAKVDQYRGFMFIDLLEGIGRVADTLCLPSMVEIENAGFENPMDWLNSFELEEENPLPRRASMEYDVPPTRPLHVKTEPLLDLMWRRLDFDWSQGDEFSREHFLKRIKKKDKERGN